MQKLSENESLQFFVKFIIPAILAVGIKAVVEMKKDKTKISFLNICMSLFTGVGGAYIFSDVVKENFGEQWQSVVIALIAITTDKIFEYVIFKWNIDILLTAIFEGFVDLIKNMLKINGK